MSEVLVHVTRGGRVESLHYGDIVVANGSGHIIKSVGDTTRKTYLRSSAKPLQALNVVLSGAVEHFGLSQSELAVMCASHYAEKFHREAVLSILRKIGVSIDNLKSPPTNSVNFGIALKQAASGHVLDAVDSNCSGKHAGMLATCVARGYPLTDYMNPEHQVQRDIVSTMAEMCCVPPENIGIGEDGCGVPVHYMSLAAMARGYARLSSPDGLRSDLRRACEKICTVMNAYPEMIAGTGGFCTELIKHTGGRLVAKLGAEGVYCVGLIGRDIGIALKIDDGSVGRVHPVTVMHILTELDFFESGVPDALHRFATPQNKNDHGHVVGDLRPVFSLR